MCLLLKKKNYYMKVRFKVQNWIVVCFCIRIHFFLPCVCVYLFLINKFKKKKSYIWRWGSRFKIVFGRRVGVKNPRHWRLGIRLDTDYHASAFVCLFFFFFFEVRFVAVVLFLVCPVCCSWDPQTSFFFKIFIKNESHDIIHTFKNYFTIIFSIFSF